MNQRDFIAAVIAVLDGKVPTRSWEERTAAEVLDAACQVHVEATGRLQQGFTDLAVAYAELFDAESSPEDVRQDEHGAGQ